MRNSFAATLDPELIIRVGARVPVLTISLLSFFSLNARQIDQLPLSPEQV